MFPMIGFLVHHILRIVDLQIETNLNFFWIEYFLVLGDVVCNHII
jgi:hypothetical protein